MSSHGTPTHAQAAVPPPAFIAVTAALLAGSSTGLFLAIIFGANEMILSPARLSNDKYPAAHILFTAMLCLVACLSASGIATAAGLLRFRAWARTSALVLGCILALTGVLGLMVTGIAISLSDSSSSRLRFIVVCILGGWFLCTCMVGIWHLVLLNQPKIRALFGYMLYGMPAQGAYTASAPSGTVLGVPVGVIVVTAYTLLSIPLDFITIARSDPTLMFNYVFLGSSAKAILLAFCVVRLGAGIGLLQLRPWGYYVALAIEGIVLADCLSCILPSYEDRAREMLALVPRLFSEVNPNLYASRMRIYSAFSAVVSGFIFALLCRYRSYFMNSGTPNEVLPEPYVDLEPGSPERVPSKVPQA
jgi:hypothetical protein